MYQTFACKYNWVPVKVNGKTGYVASNYLKKGTSTTALGSSAAATSKRPSFSSMWNSYPDDDSDALRKAKGLPSTFENTCAIRLSYALMGSGITLPPTGFKDKFGKNIHIRVKEIMNYFTKMWGKPELKLKDEKDASKYKGVIVFTDCNFSDAFGHVDVWDGKECARGCYWDRCSTYHLWQLK